MIGPALMISKEIMNTVEQTLMHTHPFLRFPGLALLSLNFLTGWNETCCVYASRSLFSFGVNWKNNGMSKCLSDLLEDAQLGEGSRDVQLDQLQARLPVWRTWNIWETMAASWCIEKHASVQNWSEKWQRELAGSFYLQFQCLRWVLLRSSTSLLLGPDRCYTALQGTATQRNQYEREEEEGGEHDDWTETTSGDETTLQQQH